MHFAENLFDFFEKLAALKLGASRAPEITFEFAYCKVVVLHREPDFRRKTMNEFGTEFDRVIKTLIKLGEDTAANAIAGFDDLNP